MGKIRQGILGGFSGKVGSVVGTSWKGRAVMKAMPLSVANPRTALQVKQRTRFRMATMLGSQLLSGIIKPLNDRFAGNISGVNAFVRRNIANMDEATGLIQDVQISAGRMIAPVGLNMSQADNAKIVVEWDNGIIDMFAMPTDRVFMSVVPSNPANGISIGREILGTTRDNSSAEILLDNMFESGESVIVSVAFLRADGTVVSNSSSITVVLA